MLALTGALGTAAMAASPVSAQRAGAGDEPRTRGRSGIARERPFVEHRLALQLSDRDEDKQAMILSVTYNMLKAYAPDLIDIEVVAFGPGIDLLRAGSAHRVRVDSLVAQSVRFDVCMNTVETIERNTGQAVDLNPNAHKVQAGVARILALCEDGYVLVRP